jgi:cell wall-associated NlpC family hydrolase
MDRRVTPANGRVAARGLEGQVEAERFVEPVPRQVIGYPFLLAEPGGGRDRQVLRGDLFDVYDRTGGWAYGRARKDGYCGWLPETALTEPAGQTHRVAVRTTWACPIPGVRQPALYDLHFGSRVRALGQSGGWTEIVSAGVTGFVPTLHLKPADSHESDPLDVARLFLGTPYLWAGNTGFGIDCSGLVQAALLACGLDCPGDSDLQEAALGRPLDPDEPLRPRDLLFWNGHVAMLAEEGRLLHANGAAMLTVYEPLDAAIARILAAGDPVTSRRRLEF